MGVEPCFDEVDGDEERVVIPSAANQMIWKMMWFGKGKSDG